MPTQGDGETNPEINTDSSGKVSVRMEMLENAEDLTVKSAVELVFNQGAVETLKKLNADVEIKVTKADVSKLSNEARTLIGDRPVYDLAVTSGSKKVTDLGKGLVSVRIPYTLKTGEDPNAIVVYSGDSNGNMSVMNGGIYNTETKTVVFKTNRLSLIAVGCNEKEFTDVPAWAAEYVTFLAARGVTNGIGGGKYGAGNNITRADFVTLLARIAGVDLSKYSASGFSDVNDGVYYAGAVGWASENVITKGTGNNQFSPKASITRQDMAVMIRNFAKAMKYELPKVSAKMKFTDQDSISSYAADAASALQQAGIIEGRIAGENNTRYFAPKDNATRAEVAKILTMIIKGMAE